MKVQDKFYRTLWPEYDRGAVAIIDQTALPYELRIRELETAAAAADAILTMRVRGAPLIGVTAAYGLALAMQADASDAALEAAINLLARTRPTAVNLSWALARMRRVLAPLPPEERNDAAWREAAAMADEDVATNQAIGRHGLALLREKHAALGRPINLLTHCNAGWLATIDWGTALAPIFMAHDAGVPIHVWVDETRPRNQGLLTAWELASHGVPHTVIADNAGGHLMQRGAVDFVLVGADRVSRHGDVCNKIGTYLKALAAHAHRVPFHVAFPASTIDWKVKDALADIPIEERGADEMRYVTGHSEGEHVARVRIIGNATAVANPAFDLTPAQLVTGLITDRGTCTPRGLARLYPEFAAEDR